MIQLVSKYGTRYMIPALNDDITNDINLALETGDTIDIQGAVLSNPVGYSLALAMERHGLKVVDTVNASMQKAIDERLDIIKHRNQTMEEIERDFIKVDISQIRTEEQYIDLLRRFKGKPSKVRLVSPSGNMGSLQIAWLCNWLFRSKIHEFFITDVFLYIHDFIESEWLPKAKHHDTYWELTKPGVVLRQVKDGMVEIEGKGKITEEHFRATHTVLPGELTTVNLLERTKGMFNPEWELVAKKLEDTMNPVIVEKRSIRDYIPTV